VRCAALTAVLVAAQLHRAIAQPEPAAPAAADPAAPAPDPGAAVAAAPLKASSDDIDLSSLGLEPGGSSFDDKLNIYGFADVGWSWEHWERASTFVKRNTLGFAIGNLNIYLAKNLTAKARTLAEIRFTLLPNGSQNADGTYVDTSAQELTNFFRPSQWGGIVIERAYAEYDLTEHLTVRLGHWLTPYGVWNIDHGSPVILGTGRPYIIGEQFFPEHQTGLDVFGNHYEHGFKLDYHLTASNGRGGTEAQQDQDTDLALGGRLAVETPWGLKLGASYYHGRYTGLVITPGTPAETYHEAAYGGDAEYDRGPLHLQAEIIARDRHYDEGARAATATGFVPDSRDFGAYVLAGYRFDHLWNVMPFGYYEHYRPADHIYFAGIDGLNLGFNFRPTPALVLKLHFSRVKFVDGPELLGGQVIDFWSTQAAWVF
jgi:hypothetical protein